MPRGAYASTFLRAVLDFVAFAAAYADLAEKLVDAAPRLRTPVAGGTVARTDRAFRPTSGPRVPTVGMKAILPRVVASGS